MFTTQTAKFAALQGLGFKTPVQALVAKADIPAYFEKVKAERDALDHDIDGLVISVDSLVRLAALGIVNVGDRKCPRGQIALKFPSAGSIVTIKAIEVSADGGAHLSPVAIFDPIELVGAQVTRASLKSFRWMTSRADRVVHFRKELRKKGATAEEAIAQAEIMAGTAECVGVGSVVEVVRSGDVIPTIVRVVSNLAADPQLPTACPCCGSGVEWNGAFLDCANPECAGKEANRMVRFMTNLRVKGLGQDTLVEYANAGVTLVDFFQQDDFKAVEDKIRGKGISMNIWAKIKVQLLATQQD